MSKVQRYRVAMGYRGAAVGLKECNEGEVVKFSDHLADKAAAVTQAVQEERERCRMEEVGPLIAVIEREKAWHVMAADKARDDGMRCNSRFPSFADACFKDEAVFRKGASLLESSIAAVRSIQAHKPVEEGKEVNK